ncbi:hypothetical protein L7F22_032566 [Adiantum nelumboides]|nr:hypothetical protein [Adiantum nelumboides]
MITEKQSLWGSSMIVSEGNDEVLPKPESLEELIGQERDFEAQVTKVTRVRKDPKFYQHKIHLKLDAVPVKQHSYLMNPNLAKQVKVEIDRLLRVACNTPIDNPEWLSLIVVVSKKNKKIRICVDYRKLNAATVSDPFPLSFLDSILDDVAGHEMYSFWDGFNGYNQICMAQEDHAKTAFITAWGVFACTVMWFGLRNAPSTFQSMFENFGPYLTDFMRIFLDDLSVFGAQHEHLKHLRLCFLKCREVHFNLNSLKCAFAVRNGRLLGHVIFEDGIAIDPDKIAAIMEATALINSKQCTNFWDQARWHGRHLRFVMHLAIPINYAAHAQVFEWTSKCDLAYRRLKIQLL